jgi:hypothetical protein
MTNDLDVRARQAAAAARTSVSLVAARAVAPTPRQAWPRRLALAGAALVVVAVVAVAGLGQDVTTVSTGPAGPGGQGGQAGVGTPGPPPPAPDLGITGVPGSELATGTASDGRAWALYFSSQTSALCLGVDLRIPNVAGGACEGGPPGTPVSPYRPLFLNDARAPYFVGGRAEADVVAVTVVLADGTQVGPTPVVAAPGGPYYAVEVPPASPPASVIGHRADGTSVRYDR